MTNSIKALLLLFFIISANFLGVSFNCELQEKFKNNTLISNLIIFGIIYFSINLSSGSIQNSPIVTLKYSLYIYILFLLLIKQTFITFIINMLLICTIYIISTQIEYDKKFGNKNFLIDNQNYIDYFEIILFITLCIGFYKKTQLELNSNPNINMIDYLFKMNYCK